MDDKELLRKTILGKICWKNCPLCDGTGYQNWDEYGENLKPGKTDNPDRENGECENCEGLGFVAIYIKD